MRKILCFIAALSSVLIGFYYLNKAGENTFVGVICLLMGKEMLNDIRTYIINTNSSKEFDK